MRSYQHGYSSLNIPDYKPSALAPQQAACHECDLLNDVPELEPGNTARCHRCGAVLYKNPSSGIENSLALGIASMLLFIVANMFPFLSFAASGMRSQTYLYSAVVDLWAQDMHFLAGVVLVTCILAPATAIIILLSVLIPLYVGKRPLALPFCTRVMAWLQPWAMLDVFMIGILVSIVKLIKMAHIGPGISFWAFVGLTITLVGALALVNPRVIWQRYAEVGT